MEKPRWQLSNLGPHALRNVIAVSFLLLSIGAVGSAVFVGAGTPAGNVLINLGTEIFGILVTLAVVDLFLERRRLQERGRELAWGALHEIERIVWVWQGGPRRLGTDELLGLISSINPNDTLQPFTRTLLDGLGRRARQILDVESSAARAVPGLEKAAADLSSLRALGERGSSVTLRMVIEVLDGATVELARILGQPTLKIPAGLLRHRDASPDAQASRYYHEAGSFEDAREPGPREGAGPAFHGRSLVSLVVSVLLSTAACENAPDSGEQAAPRGAPSIGPAAADTTLEGAFAWIALDGAPIPAEFPEGSGVVLLSGSLRLDDAAAALRAGSGRFALRFTVAGATPADSAQATGEDGRFRIASDSLIFTPDGREGQPPVAFRYAWSADGALALTDDQGHVWAYERVADGAGAETETAPPR
jgi:hypothetical protein